MKLSHEQWKALRVLSAQPATIREIRAAGVDIKQGQLSEMCNSRKMGGLPLVVRTKKRRAAEPDSTLFDTGATGKMNSVYAITDKGIEALHARH